MMQIKNKWTRLQTKWYSSIFIVYKKRYFTVVASNKEWFKASSSEPTNDIGKGPGSRY
jgi:hypothetical protein